MNVSFIFKFFFNFLQVSLVFRKYLSFKLIFFHSNFTFIWVPIELAIDLYISKITKTCRKITQLLLNNDTYICRLFLFDIL